MQLATPQVYEGDEPYMFVCYAHADDVVVLPIIEALVAEGFRVWWDKGIEKGLEFPDYIADHVYGCASFVMFVSRSSKASNWCRREAYYAIELNKRFLPIYLEDVELGRGLQMSIGVMQAMRWHESRSDDEFCEELFAVRMLGPCRHKEGRRRGGVSSRNCKAGADQPVSVHADPMNEAAIGLGIEPAAVPRAELRAKLRAAKESATETRDEIGAEPASAPMNVPATKGVRGAGIGQRGCTPLQHVAEQGGSGIGLGGQVVMRSRGAVADEFGGAPGVRKRGKLADYSWVELKELSRMIEAAGSDAEGLAIARAFCLVDEDNRLQGDEKPFELKNGTSTSVRILGFRHDELESGGRAGISFEFVDIPARHRMNVGRTNAGGWEKSGLRSWLSFYFFADLPDELRQHVSSALKLTNNRGMIEEDDLSAVTLTSDKLWLLSTCEVYGTTMPIYDAEGGQYQLYFDKGVSPDRYGLCEKCRTDSGWWLRSPGAYDSDAFLRVGGKGLWNLSYANSVVGVSPGFCF